MRVPRRWTRRLLLWPLPVIVAVMTIATVPLLVLVALVGSYRLPGKLRLLRSLGLAIVYVLTEAAVMLTGLVYWIVSGFGWKLGSPRFIDAHYRLLRRALAVLVGAGQRLFSLDIALEGTPLPAADTGPGAAPLVVMSRHAGPADSILVLHEVMSWQGRRPRIVLKDLLQLDPSFDLLLNRLPNRFISPTPGDSTATIDAIAELAGGMTERDAFLIFPEGGNFTEKRRVRAIERLSASGNQAAAERAAELHNVLPPRPAGTTAALQACPTADAVFVAHTGLESLAGIGDLWTAIPEHKTLEMTWRSVPAATVPRDDDGIGEMLFLAWEAIDEWIDVQRGNDEPDGAPT